jgi:hypothetical protein
MFNYLLFTEGEDVAKSYLKGMKQAWNKRASDKLSEDNRQAILEDGWGTTVATNIIRPFAEMGGAVESLGADNPYAPANIFPGFYGWGGYPFGYMNMMNGAAQNAYPYSAPYGTAGGSHPFNY